MSISKTSTYVSQYQPTDEAAALEYLPEIEDIGDGQLRDVLADIFVNDVPAYFWTAPASRRYHAPEHRSRHGLWLHTKRVATVFERTAKSYVKQGKLTWTDIDHGRAACLLNDTFKYGTPPTSADSTVSNHDKLAADFLRGKLLVPDAVADAVEAHNGSWYVGKNPETFLEQAVHVADMVASTDTVRVAVKDPHPILQEQFPRVSRR